MSGSRYHLLRPLSQGGAGRVWLAEDRHNHGRPVALKRLHRGVDEAVLQREFDVLRKLSHPHVARVLDFHPKRGTEQPFLVEGFVDGPDLKVACEGLGQQERARLLAQVLRGLEYVHARGVVHGDIKPDNILVTGEKGDQRACLIDFGLASHPGEGADGIAGTAAYMAPEVIREQPRSFAADLYAFGVTAYEVLCGRRPFPSHDPAALLRAHLEDTPEAPSKLEASLPPTVDRLILRLLEKQPGDRPQSAREVLDELGAALGLRLEQETADTLKGYLRSGRLVGRSSQLDRAGSLWRGLRLQSEVPRQHLLWWWGPSGAGRSRLLQEIGGDALIDGADVVHARGGEGGALGPFRTWLRGLGRGLDPLQGARDRWQAVERAVSGIMLAASERPVLLTLDDADDADELTHDALRVLVVQMAACYAPGSEVEAPRLAILVASDQAPTHLPVTLGALFEMQAIPALSAEQLSDWLDRLVPAGSLPAEFVDGVYRLTEGLPAHVVTLLGALAEAGHLTMADGGLVVAEAALSAPLPASLRDALALREARLDPASREVLEVLRALRRGAPARLVSEIVGQRDTEETRAALGRLTDRGLVGVVPGPEVFYRAEGSGVALDDSRRRELHARIARTLMGLGGRDLALGFGMEAVARHARLAVALGEERLAAAGYRAALAAALEAREIDAGEHEARLLTVARELARGGQEERPVALRLGGLNARLGRFDEAAAVLEAVRADEGASDEDRAQAELALARLALDRGDYPAALAAAEALLSNGGSRADAQAKAGRALLMMGRYDDALVRCEDGLAGALTAASKAELCNTRALIHYYTDRPDQALPDFQRAGEAFEEAGDPVGRAAAVNGVGLIHHRRGEFDEALVAYERSLEIAQQSGDRKRVAVAAMNIGTVLHETGRPVAAAERYRESLQACELLGDDEGVAKAAMNLGNLLIHTNRLAEARFWLDRSLAEAQRAQNALLAPYAEALLGKIDHHEHDLEAARRRILTAVSSLREMGNAGEAGELFIELGMVARTAGDIDGMKHFAQTAAQAAESSGAEKQMAWVRFLRGEAGRMGGDVPSATAELRAALVLADRHRLQDLGWLCEGALARCFREQGNPMEARARFSAASERIFAEAAGLTGRDRDLFLAAPERAAMVEESRLALGDGGALAKPERESREQLLRIMEINRRLVTEREPQRLLEFILDSAITLTGAERGFVILASEGAVELDIRAARNIDRESMRKNRTKLSRSITRDVIETGEPVITVDAGEDSRFREASSVHHLKLRSILCFPLRTHERTIGAIYLDNRFQASTFQDNDLALIGAFSDQAAVAINNALLHEQMVRAQEELEQSNRRIEALNRELSARVVDQAARLAHVESRMALQREQLETRYRYDNIVGSSTPMQRIFTVLDRVTDTSVPVLIQGESGTGKELVARAIHYNGEQRRDRAFVSVNCAALTETLLESELFGHTKGAFTGADRDRKGLFEVADGGTLFLDEVADMSLAMQAKLLRALQEGEIWPVGARAAIQVDVRIVAACNRDLDDLVKEGVFRQDLYFRLHVVKIELPPLRVRGEDLVLLVQHFLTRFHEKHGGHQLRIAQSALDRLLRYGWPGNVRELEACLMNAALFCDDDTLTEGHFTHKPELFKENAPLPGSDRPDSPMRLAGELLDLGNMSLSELEEKAILASLERTEGNKVEAARRLGITRQTLYNKLKSLGIEVRRRVKRT